MSKMQLLSLVPMSIAELRTTSLFSVNAAQCWVAPLLPLSLLPEFGEQQRHLTAYAKEVCFFVYIRILNKGTVPLRAFCSASCVVLGTK